MESTTAASNTSDVVGTDGKERRVLVREGSSAAGPRGARAGARKEAAAREDLPSLATADPAFWIKGLD